MNSPGNTVARWLAEPGKPLRLSKVETSSTAGAPGDEAVTEAALARITGKLQTLQERLWAEHSRSVLVVLQATDTGGKDGTIRHVFGNINPQGVRVTSFKSPSPQELEHDFLWRIHLAVPGKGEIGVFNRSHYEDVGIVRVHNLVPKKVWRDRFELINNFEDQLIHSGTVIRKFFLHISKEEQKRRLQARLDDPQKRWKFNQEDLEQRKHWDEYQHAYEQTIEKTSTKRSPWYVIPADNKWYRNWAVATVLQQTLKEMNPKFPQPGDLDNIEII